MELNWLDYALNLAYMPIKKITNEDAFVVANAEMIKLIL